MPEKQLLIISRYGTIISVFIQFSDIGHRVRHAQRTQSQSPPDPSRNRFPSPIPATLNTGANTITLTYDTSIGSSDYLNLDNLVVQQSATTTTTNTTYEAETATHTPPNPFTETSWPGYTGTGSLGGWGG